MNINLSDDAVLKELGARLQRVRLNRNMTQAAVAKEAGISERTIIRIEQGHSTQLSNLLRLLRVLDLLDNLDALVPEPAISPIQQMIVGRKRRERASSSRDQEAGEAWTWGDDE